MMRGMTGVIEMASGNLTIEPWEDIDVTPSGVTIHHNDAYRTQTFIPVFTIKMVRWHEKAMEKAGRNVPGKELATKAERAKAADAKAIDEGMRALNASD